MKEIYVSIDIETNGPVPGLYSMLSLGAAVFRPEDDGATYDVWYSKLHTLPGAAEDARTMEWWKSFPDAYKEATTDQQDPYLAMRSLAGWIKGLPGRPIPVCWPATFDFGFVNWYMHRFRHENLLGFAALDIRSYLNGLAGYSGYYGLQRSDTEKLVGKINTTGLRPHVARDDAIEQGRLFMALLKYARNNE